MPGFADLKPRVLALLEDSSGTRYKDNLLEAAMRLALDEIDQRLPRVVATDVIVATPGREQVLTGITGCLYLVSLTWPRGGGYLHELSPDQQFTYYLKDGTPTLYFTGADFPQEGDTLTVHYATPYTLSGLEGALETTLPTSCESALVIGTAGKASLLRAGGLIERYGAHPGESARLMEISRLWLNNFFHALEGLKVMQEFGFPPGFALDLWDRMRG